MRTLEISSRAHGTFSVLLDDDDYQRVVAHGKWYIQNDYRTKRKYVVNRGKGSHATRRVTALHRFITNAPAGLVVDHINHDTLDNRKSNLRVTTVAANSRNKEKVKGYIRTKVGFKPYIKVQGKRVWGKVQTTERQAHAEYLKLRALHWSI